MREEENEVKTERWPLMKTKKVEREVKTVTVYKLNIKHTPITASVTEILLIYYLKRTKNRFITQFSVRVHYLVLAVRYKDCLVL